MSSSSTKLVRVRLTRSVGLPITLSPMNFSGYVHHVTVFSWMLTPACCFRLRNDLYCVGWGVKLYSLTHPACCLVVWLGLGLDTESDWLVGMHTYYFPLSLSLSLTTVGQETSGVYSTGNVKIAINRRYSNDESLSWSCVSITSMASPAKTSLLEYLI